MDDYAAEPVLTSKKLAALSLIWAKMWGRPNQKAETTVVLKAYPGSREEILVAHCRQFARENHYRLFQCISLVDFFARVQGKLDWKQVICIADQFDADIQVAEALLIVMGLRITNCVPDEIHAWAEEIASPPHLLEWARAGPIADVDLSHFKRLFIVVINLLTIECPFAKLKYIFLISLGGKGYKPILPAALWEVAKGILIRFLIRRKPDEAAVYWTDQN